MDYNDGDESDDMDISDDGMEEQESNGQPQDHAPPQKRKIDNHIDDATNSKKRKKTPASLDRLPPGIIRWILFFTTPATLMRCQRVNKKFKALLTIPKSMNERSSELAIVDKGTMSAKPRRPTYVVVDSVDIWMNARRTTYPSLPRPLEGFTDPQMLRLVTTLRCHGCNKFDEHAHRVTSALNGGPGAHGIRPIWQFGFASCGDCLMSLCIGVKSINNLCCFC